MPAPSPYATSVAQSTHDGSQTWENRATSAFGFTDTTPYAPVMHLSSATRRGHFFIFKVEGIEQGRQINSAQLRIRNGNGWTFTSRTYIAVENHLDPAGAGAPTTGVAGSGAWSRLGRQSASTMLFGLRCGPTHSATPLSSAGYSVRDPQAYVYRAFADGREPAATTEFLTDNFAGALQALVNDAGWNPITQYVMVHLFPDSPGQADTSGVGDLSGITWASGQTGASTANANGGGQLRTYDFVPASGAIGDQAPALVIEHESSLVSVPVKVTTAQKSEGRVRIIQPTTKVAQWRGVRFPIGVPRKGVVPGMSSGTMDTPIANQSGVNPQSVNWGLTGGNPIGPRLVQIANTLLPSKTAIQLESYAPSGEYPNGINFTLPLTRWPVKYDWPLTRYSLRFHYQINNNPALGMYPLPLYMMNGNTRAWSIRLQHYANTFPEVDTTSMRSQLVDGNGTAITAFGVTPRLPAGPWIRFEVQVDETRDPKVTVHIFRVSNNLLIHTLTGNPTSVAATHAGFGQTLQQQFEEQGFGDIEVWADYDLGGEFDDPPQPVPHPYVPQKWEWLEKLSSINFQPLDDLGTVTAINPGGTGVVLDGVPLTYEDDKREVWMGPSPAYTTHSSISYATGGARNLDLFIPNGIAPAGGWPLYTWIHGGFFTAGTKNEYAPTLRDHCIARGWAFATVEYVLGQVVTSGSYPAWNVNASTGRYPSFLICAKLAGKYLMGTGAALYNLNPTRQIVGGHSAGGYISFAAFVSRNVTTDGSGRPLTLAGNTAFGGSPGDVDPQWAGYYGFCPPIDMQVAVNYDPSHPDWPFLDIAGTLHVTARSFMGRNVNTANSECVNTGVDHMLDRAVNLYGQTIGPMAHQWGTSDYLVHWEHIDIMEAKCAELGLDYSPRRTPGVGHVELNEDQYDPNHFLRFLKRFE
jgi:acetyl esterase/lipase